MDCGVSAPGRDNTAVRSVVGFDKGLFAKPTASSVVHVAYLLLPVLVEISRTFHHVFGLLPKSCSTFHLERGLHSANMFPWFYTAEVLPLSGSKVLCPA